MLNAFRNLYKIWSNAKVVAFVTAGSEKSALAAYRAAGGKAAVDTIEQLSWGYPEDVCKLTA
jgi:hypothetical protein